MKNIIRIIVAATCCMIARPLFAWDLDVNGQETDGNVYSQDQIVVAIQSGNTDCIISITDVDSNEQVAGAYCLYQPYGGYMILLPSHPVPGIRTAGGRMGAGLEVGFSGLPEGRHYTMNVFCPDLDQEISSPGGCLDFGSCQFYTYSPMQSSAYCSVSAYIGELMFDRLDLRRQFPLPKDQGNWQASCVAWSISTARTYQLGKKWGWTNLNDPSVRMSPAYIYNQICPTGGGMSFEAGLYKVRDEGCDTLSDMPYDAQAFGPIFPSTKSIVHLDPPTAAQRQNASLYKTSGFGFYRIYDNNISSIKQALKDGNPVLIGVNVVTPNPEGAVGWNWVWHGSTWYEPLPYYTYEPHVNYASIPHAVCLVGYDDYRNTFLCIDSLTIDYKAWGIDFSGWPVQGIKTDVHACYREIPYSEYISETWVMTEAP